MDTLIATLTDRRGKIVDAVRFSPDNHSYSFYQLERMAQGMRDGDTITCSNRRLHKTEVEELRKAEQEAEAEAKRIDCTAKAAALRAAADKLEAGDATFTEVVNQFSDEIPF